MMDERSSRSDLRKTISEPRTAVFLFKSVLLNRIRLKQKLQKFTNGETSGTVVTYTCYFLSMIKVEVCKSDVELTTASCFISVSPVRFDSSS